MLEGLQEIINTILNTCQTITQIQELNGSVCSRYKIVLEDDSRLLLRCSPLHYTMLLHHQQNILESNDLATRLIREETNVPVLKVYHYTRACNGFTTSYMLSEFPAGITLERAQAVLSADAFQQTENSLSKHLSAIHKITSPTFGYLSENSTVYSTWREFFLSMFHHLLRDAEDLMLILPYDQIRSALIRCESCLDDVKVARLTLCKVQDDQIYVDEQTGEITGISVVDVAIWGDPLMESLLWNPSLGLRKEYGYGLVGEEDDDSRASVRILL